MPTFRLERAILKANPAAVIAGIDEAGRGPWAGPVVAGAAILDPTQVPEVLVRELDDSKKLTATTRERLFDLLLFLSPCCKPLLALHLWRELDQSIVLELCKLLRGGGRRHRRRRAAQAPGNCATEDDSTRTAP